MVIERPRVTSNHAMERTAARCVFQFGAAESFLLRPARAFGGGRSSYSR